MFITRTVLLTVVLFLCCGLAMAGGRVSVYPLAHFAGQVGGLLHVTNVTTTEIEPRPEVRLIKNLRLALSCK
ncbi:MAG: hypothetical protein HQL04_08320 [Nitrospirae bacterium]|nr:hypothetical protein [Nitrospirota bacterium]